MRPITRGTPGVLLTGQRILRCGRSQGLSQQHKAHRQSTQRSTDREVERMPHTNTSHTTVQAHIRTTNSAVVYRAVEQCTIRSRATGCHTTYRSGFWVGVGGKYRPRSLSFACLTQKPEYLNLSRSWKNAIYATLEVNISGPPPKPKIRLLSDCIRQLCNENAISLALSTVSSHTEK